MDRHRILFKYDGTQDDESIVMAFAKKAIEQRKEWLTSHMEDCKRRKELGLQEQYLYTKSTKHVTYAEFINLELVLFSNADNVRSIPSGLVLSLLKNYNPKICSLNFYSYFSGGWFEAGTT